MSRRQKPTTGKRPKLHVRRDDFVTIIAGKEKGKSGKVLRVFPEEQRVLVEKVNFIKRHTRPGRLSRQGGIVEREGKIHISNVRKSG